MESSTHENTEQNSESPRFSRRERLEAVAKRQRILLFAVLAQLFLNPLSKLASEILGSEIIVLPALLGITILAIIVITACRLSLLLNSLPITILLTILAIVPLLNLVVLLILIRQSTNILKTAGLRVGLLGVSPQDIRHHVG